MCLQINLLLIIKYDYVLLNREFYLEYAYDCSSFKYYNKPHNNYTIPVAWQSR